MVNPVQQSTRSANTGGRSVLSDRIRQLRAMVLTVALVILAVSAYFARQYFHDSALKQKLIGTWHSAYVREDGTVDTFVWKFLADGTMRHHLKGQPSPETGSVDDYMWWHVSDGHLVLTFDRQSRQDASFQSKAKASIRYFKEIATGTNLPLERQDVCIVRDAGGDSIEITLHSSENTLDSWVGGGTSVLTRPSDGITK